MNTIATPATKSSRSLLAAAALAAAAFFSLPGSASAWAEYNGWQPSALYNPSGSATRVYNYDRNGGGFSLVNYTGILYGSANYTLWHPYVNRNYDHWCWDYSRGTWSAIHTKKLTRY